MNLVALNADTLALQTPLPFVLRGAQGGELLARGQQVRDHAQLQQLAERGAGLFVDTDTCGDAYRAHLVALGAPPTDWPALHQYTAHLLLAEPSAQLARQLGALADHVLEQCRRAPDAALLALVQLSARELRQHSATRALLVVAVTTLVARETLRWDAPRVATLARAALTMNLSVTALQDRLALQSAPLKREQIQAINAHPEQSVQLLRQMGVHDADWLEAVANHHQRVPGQLHALAPALQMARLIQRADQFGARIAPRATRSPMNMSAAMQGSYYDENGQVEEAGAALVKTLGRYPPGACVRLISQEVGVVLRRGPTPTTPRVAVLVDRQGLPCDAPLLRDAAHSAFKVAVCVPCHSLRVQLPLHELLGLVA
ncbi:hypothetical protein GCM10022279_04900 [Comamonas faecalis]|uniref:Phosphohydrolase n=1 Tax=Comamonas faecalis TaxID=1387849 RepID=A0ABP7QND1_9BURK